MSYYPPIEDIDYPGETRLTVRWDRPTFDIPNGRLGMIEAHEGPRVRIVIEGETELVRRLQEAMGPEADMIWREIKGLPV